MSKVEVNQISSQCGSTLTIGQSGDTVTLAAGATQSGFGRTGTVDWDTTAKTASFTAVSGNGYFINTTSGAITVTLPASPSAGDIVAIADYARTFATNNVTIDRNSSLIQGTANNGTIETNGQSTMFVYVDGTKGWIPTEDQTTNNYGAAYITATGGTIVTCGDFKVHSFTGPGTFTVCSVGNPAGSDSVQVLLVAGGGGGGLDNGGGGGAGGAVFTPTAAIPVTATSFPITIGGGGTGTSPPNASNNGTNGSNTTGLSLTAIGGGVGGIGSPSVPLGQGADGGSGAGDGAYDGTTNPAGGSATQPTQPGNSGTFGAGFAGGKGGASAPNRASGGGGGAAEAGFKDTSGGGGGNGGNGVDVTPVFGTAPQPFYIANGTGAGASAPGRFAGGGGGGAITSGGGGDGGLGGGGNGGGCNPAASPSGTGTAGITNTGGGGGGGANYGPAGPGGNGGSGIVLIRYKFQ